MEAIPIQLKPGQVWLHFGCWEEGLFPLKFHPEAMTVWLAYRWATHWHQPILIGSEMSRGMLHSAAKNDGAFDARYLDRDSVFYADVVTIGVYTGTSLVVSCVKNRNGEAFPSFRVKSGVVRSLQATTWDLLEQSL